MYDISLKRKWDAEAVRMYQQEQFEEAKSIALATGKAEGKAEGLAVGKAEGLAEGKAEGLAAGKAEGLAEGERKKALATALKLKEMGIPIDIIATGTGLTIEEVENLK